MENIAITENMLADRKHLNDEGFIKLLANIRYNLFRKIPTFRPRKSANSLNQHNKYQRYEQRNQRNSQDSRFYGDEFYRHN